MSDLTPPANLAVSRRMLGGAFAALAAAPALAQMPPNGAAGDARLMQAQAALTSGDWMAQVKAQHQAIDRMFAEVAAATSTPARAEALRQLKVLLTAHSVAEEAALYPGLALNNDKGAADRAYKEQSLAKVMMAKLDNMPDKMNREFDTTLAALTKAIRMHVAEEERQWYPRLKTKADPAMDAKMTADFRESFTRYLTA